MMYSAYKLNKQGDSFDVLLYPIWNQSVVNKQGDSFDVLLYPIWNQSVVPCPVLTTAS